MIRIVLPASVSFTCPGCRVQFSMAARSLEQRQTVGCPICSVEMGIFESIAVDLRRRIYHSVRNHIEQRVYEQQQLDKASYFEDLANLL